MKKNTIGHLQDAQSSISSMLEICTSSNKVSALKVSLNSTLAVLSGTVEHLQTRPRVLSKTKKALVAIQNTVQGMLEGVLAQDLSVKDFRAICTNLQSKFVPRMNDAILTEVPALKPVVDEDQDEGEEESPSAVAEPIPEHLQELRKVVVSGGSLQDMLKTVRSQIVTENRAAVVPPSTEIVMFRKPSKEEVNERYEMEKADRQNEYFSKQKEGANSHLVAMNKRKADMPTSLKSHGDASHPFTMVKMPLVPLFDAWTMTQETLLKRLGIPHIPLAGYMIFDDQLLLVISKSAAMKAMKPEKKTKAKPTVNGKPVVEQIKGKRWLDYTREAVPIVDYARVILDIINERSTGSTYSMVSEHFVANPRNQDLVCFWVMGTKKLSALIRSSGFGSSKVKSWGFPWVDLTVDQERKMESFVHPSDNKDHPRFLEYEKNKHLRPQKWVSSDTPLVKKII